MRHILIAAALFLLSGFCVAQVPLATGVQILKAEDARRYDAALESLMKSPNQAIRERAVLAAGRIGREEALPLLSDLLTSDKTDSVRATAAFAIGEIESIKGADTILTILKAKYGTYGSTVVGRSVEAAGKIAAANAKDEKAKALGKAIVSVLELEYIKRADHDPFVVQMALTAALRARPEGADEACARFLKSRHARLRADAANTLARLRAKNANAILRDIVLFDPDWAVRINAIRALSAAEDKEAFNLLLEAATGDRDPAIRIAAIRALGSLKDTRAYERLEKHQMALLEQAVRRDEKRLGKAGYYRIVPEQNEMLEITTSLGNILAGTRFQPPDNKTTGQNIFETAPGGFTRPLLNSPETSIARAKVDPELFMLGLIDDFRSRQSPLVKDWHEASSLAQGLGVLATLPKEKYVDSLPKLQSDAEEILRLFLADPMLPQMARSDVLTAYAAFKPKDLDSVLRNSVENQNYDPFVRATAAQLLGEQPRSDINLRALYSGYLISHVIDKNSDDAQIASLEALFKMDQRWSLHPLGIAIYSSTNYLVRKKAIDLLTSANIDIDKERIESILKNARKDDKIHVLPPYPTTRSKLGVILNTDTDYRRALSRKDGSVKAVINTEKGTFTIDFYPEDAPLTVDNFIKLARTGYFNGLEVHRVVPNFVMQDGDPRGDGNGGPGWSIRCEINTREYDRGAVGMALSGKDTGGSQWFVTHLPQPHLDGGYTVFGHVNEKDMKVVDSIVRGDKILTVKIVGR